MNRSFVKTILFCFIASALITACKKEDDTENEVITTVVVQLKSTDGSIDRRFTWNDPDGDGGLPPTVEDIILARNKEYDAQVYFYDRSKSPEVNVTPEIERESDDHLLVYRINGALQLTITPTDADTKGRPFRLKTRWTTKGASTGSVLITLRHNPNKLLSNPDETGSVDAEVEFPVRIQ
ncbi:MAG: hypothetical protein NZM43_07900 [Saprospiraceae bacterium]|nr:hypothetical protein [Saprospiraceae bacterium]MDW8484230.1 hypothetical protein [Saprospiraceae bacterium]